MAFIQKIRDVLTHKLKSPYSVSFSLSTIAGGNNEQARKAHFQRLYDYYVNDEDKIKRYTREAMLVSFKPETIKRMMLPYFNIVRRIVNRICVAYKLPAERYIVVGGEISGDTFVPDATDEKAQESYQELLEGSNINAQSKLWHRLAKLLDTVYVQPVWREDHIEYDVYAPHQLTVLEDEDNYLLPARVSYEITKPDGSIREIVWTEDVHWVYDSDGVAVQGENEWGGVNRYRVIPLVPLRLREVENHWGEGDTQLMDINEKVNVLLASGYYNAIMQAHGQAVAINMNIKGEIVVGPDSVIQADNAQGDQPASFTYVNPNPAIEPVMKKIDWMLKTAAMMRGLPASSVSIEVDATSGAAKAIDNWELLEIRQDDLEFLRPFEKRLFEVSRIVWNFHQKSDLKIPDESTFGVDFVEPKTPTTEIEELKAKEIKLKLGLWTPVDDVIDEDEGIDKERALELVREKLEIRNELNDQFGLGGLKLLDDSEEGLQMGSHSGESKTGESGTTL